MSKAPPPLPRACVYSFVRSFARARSRIMLAINERNA